MAEPTAEQRKAIRAFIDSTLLPLIGDVLEKKLTQAALTIRDLLDEPRYFCNKCGYCGPAQVNHQRPNGTGECDYMAALMKPAPGVATPPRGPNNE
jgi:hypothetical protein